MDATSLHHWITETPEERLQKEIEFYKELKEDETGRLHDSLGRFASDSQEEESLSEPSFWEGLKIWGELLGFYSIEWTPRSADGFGTHVPRVKIGKTAWGALAFLLYETFRLLAK